MSSISQGKVAVSGASGFVGRWLLRETIRQGMDVRVLVRDMKRLPDDVRDHVDVVEGDLFHSDSLKQLTQGCEAVIHLVGIIAENPREDVTFERIHVQGTQNLLQAATTQGVKRWVQMSAINSRLDAPARYHQTKAQAEIHVQKSAMSWTIIQPSLIHGPDGELMQMIKGFWQSWIPPFVPYFAGGLLGTDGGGLVQPVYVEDVAKVFVHALSSPATVGKVYPLGGRDVMSWPAMYRICKKHLPNTLPKPILPVPVWKAKALARLHVPGLPFNEDQVLMSQEDSTCDPAKVEKDFDIRVQGFEDTLKRYASQM